MLIATDAGVTVETQVGNRRWRDEAARADRRITSTNPEIRSAPGQSDM